MIPWQAAYLLAGIVYLLADALARHRGYPLRRPRDYFVVGLVAAWAVLLWPVALIQDAMAWIVDRIQTGKMLKRVRQ